MKRVWMPRRGQGDLQLVVGAAVQVGRGNDVVARIGQDGEGQRSRRVPEATASARHPAFQRGDALLEARRWWGS